MAQAIPFQQAGCLQNGVESEEDDRVIKRHEAATLD